MAPVPQKLSLCFLHGSAQLAEAQCKSQQWVAGTNWPGSWKNLCPPPSACCVTLDAVPYLSELQFLTWKTEGLDSCSKKLKMLFLFTRKR